MRRGHRTIVTPWPIVKIIAAADGSALGNPGPAGWGWYADRDHWAAGGWPHGTNNMGELMAVLDLLRATAHLDADLTIQCDSKYVIDSVTKWMPGWKKNGWKKKDKKPVLNLDLMQGIDAALEGRRDRVTFEWVKGHAGHVLNEQADRLANGAATTYQRGGVPDPGPAFGPRQGEAPQPPTTTQREGWDEPDLFSELSADDIATSAPQPRDLTPVEAVIEAERALLTDALRNDPSTVASLLHPAWHEVGASGRLWTRAEMLATIAPLPERTVLEVVQAEQIDLDTVLLVWRAVAPRGSTLRTSVWVRAQGQWLQRSHQGTLES